MKGTLCSEGLLSAAVGRAVPHPIETSKAKHSCDEFPDLFGPGERCWYACEPGGASLSPSQFLPGGLAAASERRIYRGGRPGPN